MRCVPSYGMPRERLYAPAPQDLIARGGWCRADAAWSHHDFVEEQRIGASPKHHVKRKGSSFR